MNPGYVYVLAFDNGTIKVGRTQNAARRLGSHKSSARSFGLTIADEWVSPLHVEWQANEDALKAIAAIAGGTATSPEYFSGASFDAVAKKARELPFTPPGSSEAVTPRRVPASSPGQFVSARPANPLSKLAITQRVEELTKYLVEMAYLYYEFGMSVEVARSMPVDLHFADVLDMIHHAEENPEGFAAA